MSSLLCTKCGNLHADGVNRCPIVSINAAASRVQTSSSSAAATSSAPLPSNIGGGEPAANTSNTIWGRMRSAVAATFRSAFSCGGRAGRGRRTATVTSTRSQSTFSDDYSPTRASPQRANPPQRASQPQRNQSRSREISPNSRELSSQAGAGGSHRTQISISEIPPFSPQRANLPSTSTQQQTQPVDTTTTEEFHMPVYNVANLDSTVKFEPRVGTVKTRNESVEGTASFSSGSAVPDMSHIPSGPVSEESSITSPTSNQPERLFHKRSSNVNVVLTEQEVNGNNNQQEGVQSPKCKDSRPNNE